MADASSFALVDVDSVGRAGDGEDQPQFSQELGISVDKAELLHDRQNRIEYLFHVKITERKLLSDDKTRRTRNQSINLKGTKDDCKDAAEYIRALCNPLAWLEFMYDPELHAVIAGRDILDSNLSRIEKQTKAALFSDSPGSIFIQGDELTTALADSLLCELVKENSAVGPQSPSRDSSVLDSKLQVIFSSFDLESTADSNITNYGEEIKRALLLSLSATDTRNSESTINLEEHDDSPTEVVDTGTDSADHDEDVDTFLALARSKNYSDEDAKTVIRQKGYQISDAEFVRALSTNRKMSANRKMIVKTVSSTSEDKVTRDNSRSGIMNIDIMQGTHSASSSDDGDTIDLRPGDEFHDLPSRKAESQLSGATTGVSDASGAQSKKSKNKKKKNKSKKAGHDPVEAKVSVVGKPSSAVYPFQPQVNSTGVKYGAGPNLRYIVIDGSNIAMHHGRGRVFSCCGIQLAVNYFQGRGHAKITAIVPQWRRQTSTSKYPIKDQSLLEQLHADGFVAFSPSRRVGNQNITPYDDRFILELASQTQGIVVSNDNFKDLYREKRQFTEVIGRRLLPYTLVDDIFIVPEDPLGRGGPTLDQFLSMPSHTPLSVP